MHRQNERGFAVLDPQPANKYEIRSNSYTNRLMRLMPALMRGAFCQGSALVGGWRLSNLTW